MEKQEFQKARHVFAFAVPMTVLAFLFGSVYVSGVGAVKQLDYVMVTVTAVGVFVYNWFEEKPVRVSIQKS